METEALQLERLVDDPEIRRAAAKTLKGFCLTYLPHHFPLEPGPTGAEIRLTGVSGFYSEWSPSIRTDSIKILANAKDQNLENPEGLDLRRLF
jgi:hypothetical protein